MPNAKIMFVDGPTGVGKDYFIDKLYYHLSTRFTEKKFKVVRATDMVLSSNTQTENRKYTLYDTEEDKVNEIFMGHLKMLASLNDLSKEFDTIIVNRSFLSFLIYNVYPTIIPDERIELYIETYNCLFKSYFENDISIFINLGISEPTIDRQISTIINRIKSRGDNKPIDTKWIETIVKHYNEPDMKLIDGIGEYEHIDSNGYNYIVNKYFDHV